MVSETETLLSRIARPVSSSSFFHSQSTSIYEISNTATDTWLPEQLKKEDRKKN